MGIRNRVRKAFIALGTILIIAGISSYLELVILSNSSRKAIDVGAKSIQMSTNLLDLAQQHNDVFYKYSVNKNKDSLMIMSESILLKMDSVMTSSFVNNNMLKNAGTIAEDVEIYKNRIREKYQDINTDDSWYYIFQSDVYFSFTKHVKEYMVLSQTYVVNQTTKIDDGIYRSIMLGITAIIFMILILVIFYVLLDNHFLKPVVKLTKSLDAYLVSKTPFVVKVDGKDEVYKLKEYILDLISENKSVNKKEMFFKEDN